MSDERPDIRELIERSSLGTPEAKALRATVSREQVEKVLARVRELEVEGDDEEEDLVEVVTRYGGFRHLARLAPWPNTRHFTLCRGTSAWTLEEWRSLPDHPLGLTADQMAELPICVRCEAMS
jgi:hypothetical protein